MVQIFGLLFYDDVNGGIFLGVGVGVLIFDLVFFVVCGGFVVYVFVYCVVYFWVDL